MSARKRNVDFVDLTQYEEPQPKQPRYSYSSGSQPHSSDGRSTWSRAQGHSHDDDDYEGEDELLMLSQYVDNSGNGFILVGRMGELKSVVVGPISRMWLIWMEMRKSSG